MLKIENFSKSFGDKKAVNNLNLEVKEGEIFGFIGHNGAGKTTTIKSIVGILDFEQGDVFIDGISIKKEPIKCKEKIAYIPDTPEVYENLTAIEYINFIADIFKVDEIERESKVKKYAQTFKLTDNLNEVISSYSHGMKQKLVIIAALIHSPKLIVFDEPFVGLDPQSAFALKEIMRELTKNNVCIFVSSHVLEVVEKLCDRVGIIKQGKLIACDSIEKIKGNESLEEVFLELVKDE